MNTNAEDDSGKRKCQPVLEDYYECLHHRKEVRSLPSGPKTLNLTRQWQQAVKIAALQAAYRKREASTARDDAPSAGQIRSLGLLEASREERNVKAASLLPGSTLR